MNKKNKARLEYFGGGIILAGIILFANFSIQWGSFWNFRHAAWEFLKGGLVWLVALIGLLLIIIGISDLKENRKGRKLEDE